MEWKIATKEQRKEKINRRRETEIRKERQEPNGQEQGASGKGIVISYLYLEKISFLERRL